MTKGYTLDTDEVAIIIKPKGIKGEMVGVDVGLVIGKDVGKDEEIGRVAVMAAINMAASVSYLDTYPDFEEELSYFREELLKEMYPDFYAEALAEVEQEESYSREGNVIKLKAWTKTQGNA
mgnify:CR=1 FL=1